MTKEEHNLFLMWRNIDPEHDVVCSECGGSGVRVYGSTSTWSGGIGGSTMTPDVCDKCWGSGHEDRPWVNLKKLSRKLSTKKKRRRWRRS